MNKSFSDYALMKKKEYVCPDFSVVTFTLKDVILSSVEKPSTYIDPDPGDWGDDPFGL